jgi:hypothetical protein
MPTFVGSYETCVTASRMTSQAPWGVVIRPTVAITPTAWSMTAWDFTACCSCAISTGDGAK